MMQCYAPPVQRKSLRALFLLLATLAGLGSGHLKAQISLPYTEDFSGITAANGFPSPTGGSWAKTGTNAMQPTYIANQTTYNRFGHGDTKFMAFRYGQTSGGNVYTVGPFTLSASSTYQVGIWYITDGATGFGPLSLTYGTGTTVALQSNTIASLPASITNTTYQQLTGTFTPTTSGSYYIGIKCEATSNPWYLSIDDFSIGVLSSCTGTPAPGATLSTSNPACSNSPITLSVALPPATSGITYQWETSTNGTTYTSVGATGTGSTYTVTQTAATYYRALVTCTNSTSSTYSTPVYVTQNPATSCYCVPVSTATGYYINNFATTGGVANITNSTSGDAITSPGYSNYLTQTVSAYPSNVVNFTGSFGSSTSYTFGVKIYVDWNQDGDFTGTGETVFATPAYTSSISGSFTVPAGALSGNTRIRVRADYLNGTGPASCGSIADGEAEDYTFTVLTPPACSGTPTVNTATTLSPLAVTGFNADIIANGVGAANTTTTADVDGGGYYLLDSTYQYTSTSAAPVYALPASGIINSATTSGLSWKLASASSNNSLRIVTTNGTGTLTLATPVPATNLYLLATSGTGAATIDATVTFTNATTQTVTGLTIADWYGGTPIAASPIGRVTSTNTQDGTSTNPRLYQITIPISAANASLNIASVTITRTSTAGYVQILGVSAATPMPAAVCAGTSKVLSIPTPAVLTGISYQWQESPTLGGPYTNVSTGTGGTTLTYTTPALTASRYYVLKVTCANSTLSALSNEVAVTVNPLPTLSLSSAPSNSNICGTGSVSITASGTGTSYTWVPANGLSATTGATITASPAATTTYTVTASSSAGCISTATKTVNVYSLTTVTAKASLYTFCTGGSTTLSATDTSFGNATAPTGYTNGTVSNPTTDEDFGTIVFGGLSNTTTCGSLTGTIGTATGTAGSYSDFTAATPSRFQAGSSYPLSVTSITCGTSNFSNSMAVYIDYNQNGSFTDAGEAVYVATSTISGPHTETATIVIPASAKPGVTRLRVISNEGLVSGPQMSPGYGEIEDYNIRIIKPGTVPSSGFAWSPSTSLSSPTGNSVTATPTATTTYALTATDTNGCVVTATVPITVNQLPTINITPATAAFCAGSNVSLTASGASTYSWSPAAGLSATTGATVTANPSGTTVYTVTGTDGNGCVNTANKTVTVNPLPTVAITPAAAPAICTGSNVSLTASGASTYSWTPAAGLSAATGATVTASPSGTTTYTVTGTDANGCTNTATKTVTVNPLPTVAVSPATALVFCGSGTATLTASGATSYSWSPATGLSATTGATVTASPSATATYTVTGTDANGCTNTATKTVTINPLPTVSISPAAAPTICSGSNVALTASGASTYSWSPTAGLSATTGATVTASPSATATYTVTGTDANGCTNTATTTVTVITSPIVTISPATASAICAGGSGVVLTASGASSYSWTPAAGLSATTGPTVTALPSATTTYTVTGMAANGCTGTATKTVTINPLPTIVLSPAGPTNLCAGSNITFTASGAATYTWSPAAGLSATTGATVTASPPGTTTYTVTGTDINGCVNSVSRLVTLNALPTISISPATTPTICAGSSVTLTASGGATYSWSPAAGLSSSTAAVVSASPATTTTYTVTGTNAAGCSSTATKTVNVNQLPTIFVSPFGATALCSGNGVTLTASGANTYTWSPATGLSGTTGNSVTANPAATTTYTVTGTDANGCVNSTTKVVTILGLPTITVSPFGATTICEGSGVTLTASGASTYIWSPSGSLSSGIGTSVLASPAATTTYTVTGTAANGCSNTATKTVTVTPKPNAAISPRGYVTTCQDDSVYLTATSGYANYVWKFYGVTVVPLTGSTIFPTVTGGIYTLTVTDANGCSATTDTPTAITVIQHPIVTIRRTSGTVMAVDSGYATYQWYLNGNAIAGATTWTYRASQDGAYKVFVTETSDKHCAGTSQVFNLVAVGVAGNAITGEAIRLYPNPANDILHIDAPVAISATVFGIDGKQVYTGEDVREINISQWADGIYRVVIRDKAGAYLKTEKITKVTR